MCQYVAILLCLAILCSGCTSDKKNTSSGKINTQMSTSDVLNRPLSKAELEDLRQDSVAYLKIHPDDFYHQLKIAVIDEHIKRNDSPSKNQITSEIENLNREMAQRKQKEDEAKKIQAERQLFQYSNFTLEHSYNEVLPYNGIKMSFVVQNTSDSVQTLRLSDFVLRKEGSNTVLPESALRNYTGIARNPSNPDFSDYDRDLNQREMYPGDRFFIKIEFWEQRELIRSMEGWCLVHRYKDKARNICSLHD